MKTGLERPAEFAQLFNYVGVLLRYHDRGLGDDDNGDDNNRQCDNQWIHGFFLRICKFVIARLQSAGSFDT